MTSTWGRMSSQLWNLSRNWRALRNTWLISSRHNLVFIFSMQSECLLPLNWWDLIRICLRFAFFVPCTRRREGEGRKIVLSLTFKSRLRRYTTGNRKKVPSYYFPSLCRDRYFIFSTTLITTPSNNWPTKPTQPYRAQISNGNRTRWEERKDFFSRNIWVLFNFP